MAIPYIEAYERIRTGAGDRRILFYELDTDASRQARNTLSKLFSVNNVSVEDWRDRRISELKSIMQQTHPDKPSADVDAFRKARDELAMLRKKCA